MSYTCAPRAAFVGLSANASTTSSRHSRKKAARLPRHERVESACNDAVEALERRALLTGTTGQVLVFADGPIDFTTGQFKAPVEKTIANLGQYDANGNLVGSNNGLLTGKWGSTEIYSLDEVSPVLYGHLGNVSDLSSATNDFRVDYTGATQANPRNGVLHSAQAHFYYWIDDYRRRFLTDSFIDSLELPAQSAENLKNLQYRPDLVTTPPPLLAKPVLRMDEVVTSTGEVYFQISNYYIAAARSRANISNLASLPPFSPAFANESVVGDYVGLASTWIVGFNTIWTPGFGNWQQNILAPLSDGFSGWAAYRTSGNSEVYKYAAYSERTWRQTPCGGTNVPCNKGYNLRNVMMFDEVVSNADGVFPYSPPSSWVQGQGPISEELASLFFGAVFYDIANEVGLGMLKTDMLAWKTISLITNPTTFTVRDFGAKIQTAARALWPKPGNPAQSIYEQDLVDVLTSRGIPVNGVADFRTNLPAAIGPSIKNQTTRFGSNHPASQPSVNSYGSSAAFNDGYIDPSGAPYVAYQFYKNSKYGPCDRLEITDGTFNQTTGVYNNDGTFFWQATDRELANLVLLAPGSTIRWRNHRGRCANEATGFYAEDVRPFGFRVVKATPNGFSFATQTISETSTTKTYQTTIVDPSLGTLGAATYAWAITDHLENVTAFNGQSVQFTVQKDQPFSLNIDRTRNATTDTLTLRERGNDFDRSNGNAIVRDFVTGSITGQAFVDINGNGTRDGIEGPLKDVTVYLDTNNNSVLDIGDQSTVTGTEGLWSFTGTPPGTYHVREILPLGYASTSASSGYDVTLTSGNRNQRGFDFAQFPTSFLGTLNDTFTIQDKPGDSSRVQITPVMASGTITWEASKAALGNRLTLHLSAGNDIINSSATGMTLSIDSAGGNKTLNVTGGSVTLDNDPGNEDPVKTANEPVNVTINVSTGAQVNFASTEHLAALNIATGALVTLNANGSRALVTKSLSVTGSGRLDLADNVMIVDWTGASPLGTIQTLLTSGYANGAWNAEGINSAVAAATTNRALGYAEASAIFSTFPATFAGQSVDDTAVLIRFTRYGDANLDQAVNLDDFTALAANFGLTGRVFSQGDFNYNGGVNLDDFTALAANFGQPNRVFSQGNFEYSADGVVNLDDFTILASQFGKTLTVPSAAEMPSDLPRAFARTPIFSATPQAEEAKFSITRIIDDILAS